jgi:hypothetical protein
MYSVVPVHTSMYLCSKNKTRDDSICTGIYQYVLVYTIVYWHIPVYTSMYQYVPVYTVYTMYIMVYTDIY